MLLIYYCCNLNSKHGLELGTPAWLYVSRVKSSNYSKVDSKSGDNQAPATSRVSCSEMDRVCLPSPEPLAGSPSDGNSPTVHRPTPDQDQ